VIGAGTGGETAAGPVEAAILDELAGAAPGGLRIDAWRWLAEGTGGRLRVLRGGAGAPGAETVVLLHGRGHAASVWFPCWAALAARHRLLAIDLPGFGASAIDRRDDERGEENRAGESGKHRLDRGDRGERGLAFFADPIAAFLAADSATGQGAGAGLALVGHSLGALVALELALRARLPVRRLVLIDGMGLGPAMTPASRLFFRLHPERLARTLGRWLFGRLNPAPPTPLGRRVAALELELLSARSPARDLAVRAFDALCPLAGPVFHRRDRLGALAQPVLLLWGERDAALPARNATDAQSLLRAATTVLFPRRGHSPHLEAPDEVMPPLLDFLAAGARRG
jgi:pimeloyl-ACP methyl ester carboxylesterase